MDLGLVDGRVWVRNPEVTLRREYWVIIRRTDRTHFIYPGPAGDDAIAAECAAHGALAPTFAMLHPCSPATSEEDGRRASRLTFDEARQVTTWLHRSPRFRVRDGRILPSMPTSLELLVCSEATGERATVLRQVCARANANAGLAVRPTIPARYSPQELEALADGLDALFGIAGAR